MKDFVRAFKCFGFKMYLTSYIQSSNMLFETFALEQGTMISNKSVIFFFTI